MRTEIAPVIIGAIAIGHDYIVENFIDGISSSLDRGAIAIAAVSVAAFIYVLRQWPPAGRAISMLERSPPREDKD
ncbi:MAG: hypothetical protein HKN14_04980 [Marinicaulis sp.]|nr:hypothetical protein [Marinicaulis sp.]NNE40256.1 hypothetical protein [Marinicaulis sp.]NNL90039.1 hypothetical protein [Marinicaulis sp.]